MLATTTGIVVPSASGVREVDREARRHRRQAGHHEDVAVGQVVRRAFVQQAHSSSRSTVAMTGPHKATASAGSCDDRLPVRFGSWRRRWFSCTDGVARSSRPGRHSGFTELLRDAGRTVIGVDLLGHGTAPKPHDPEAYDDLTTRVVEALPDEPVDADRILAGRDHPAAAGDRRAATVQPAGAGRHRCITCSTPTTPGPSGSSPRSRATAIPTTTWRGCSCSTPGNRATTSSRSPR